MPSSLTRNLAILMRDLLWSIYRGYTQSASLDEKIMWMEALICTLSAISVEGFDHDEPMSLMWEAAIQTSAFLTEVQTQVTTMRSRMVMLSEGDSNDQVELEFTRMSQHGLLSIEAQMSHRFGNLLHDSIQKHCAPITETSELMSTGDTTPLSMRSMFIPGGSCLSWEWYLTWLDGEKSVLELLEVSKS